MSNSITTFEFPHVPQIWIALNRKLPLESLVNELVLLLLPKKTCLSHACGRFFSWLIRQYCIIRKSACTELTVVVSGPAVSCTSATLHTLCLTTYSVLTTIHPSREKGYTQTHFAVSFVCVCYQSGLETTVNARCLVSVLFSRSRFHTVKIFPTIIRVATCLLLQIHGLFQEKTATLRKNVRYVK